MDYGLEIFKEDGTLWISPDFTPLNLIDKGVIPASNGAVFQSRIPQSKEAIFFIKTSSKGAVRCSEVISNGYKSLRIDSSYISGTVTVYCFGNIAFTKSNYGVFLFNAQGELVYSLDMKPLEMKVVNIDISGPEQQINIGRPVAVMPMWSGRTSTPNTEIGGWNIWDYHCTGWGNYVLNNRIQIAGGASGPSGVSFQQQAFYIETSIYD